jgi:biphenyl-2,3-diol 1,2-dioxygenase
MPGLESASIRGTFLHCNARHRSLALFNMPLRKRMHHFMLQDRLHDAAARLSGPDVARRCCASDGLGRHPDPDGGFSFYAATPSGFDFEIGAGGREIDPADWQAPRTFVSSAWRHKPTLWPRLKMAAGPVASTMPRAVRGYNG